MSLATLAAASYEKDPVAATQSNVVPVTEELLNREGEPGPASPSFKMSDTARFLVKKPYQLADEEVTGKIQGGFPSDLWDDRFFSEENDKSSSASEPIDKK